MSHVIKVATLQTDTPTDKGGLLEKLTKELLEAQGYEVKTQLRITGMELDLLCKHKISGKEIYVECKAYTESSKIPGEVISKLFGVKGIKKYEEAWLVTTTELSKDAAGLVDELKRDGNKDFSFYTPDKLIEAYIDAKVVQPSNLSEKNVESLIKDRSKIGPISLIISRRGNFWATEHLNGGVSDGVIFTNARTSELIEDENVLNFIAQTGIFSQEINCNKINDFSHANATTTQVCPESINLSASYIRKTTEIGMLITHPGKDVLTLDDVFVYPNLESIESDRPENIDSKQVGELKAGLKKCIIFGEDLAGKTVLAQKLQKDLNAKGLVPLYIDAEDIKDANLNKFTSLLKNSFKKQYFDNDQYAECFNEILSNEKSRIILIIDNYESLGIKRSQAKVKFHELLNGHYENVFIFANKSLEIEVMADSETRKQLTSFIALRIKQFGHLLRDELIEKWLIAADGDVAYDEEIYNKKLEISEKIRIAVGTNFVPTYPLYLLTLLQLIETVSKNKFQGSSYAELYAYLITHSLGSVNAKPEDLDFYLTYLSYLAHSFFKKGRRTVTLSEIRKIYQEYCQRMDIDRTFVSVHTLLNRAQILRVDNDVYAFSHNYSYYFFVAKYLAENLENDDVKTSVENIIKHLYRTEYANVLIFLIHHSKNKSILEKITKESLQIFKKVIPYTLTSVASSQISKLIHKEVSFTIKDERPNEYRKRHLAKKDEEEEIDQRRNKKEYTSRKDLDLFGEINLAFKLMEIMGQITSNYFGSLEANRKGEIVKEIHSLGFRALNALLEDFGRFTESLRVEVHKVVDKKKPVDNVEKEKIVDKIIYTFTEMIVYSFLKRISESVASKNIFPTLNKFSKKDATPGAQLVYLAARLNFPGGLNAVEIIKLDKLFEKNDLARRILRISVIEYLYKFDMTFSEKQSLCNKLEIKLIQNKERLG